MRMWVKLLMKWRMRSKMIIMPGIIIILLLINNGNEMGKYDDIVEWGWENLKIINICGRPASQSSDYMRGTGGGRQGLAD